MQTIATAVPPGERKLLIKSPTRTDKPNFKQFLWPPKIIIVTTVLRGERPSKIERPKSSEITIKERRPQHLIEIYTKMKQRLRPNQE